MNLKTYGQLRLEVEKDTDTEDETFIQADEMVTKFNDAVDTCESIIHNLHEDYFLDSANLTLVSGTAEYSLPSAIFATKIRGVIYKNGSDVYEITRIRNYRKFLKINDIRQFGSAEDYRYFIQHKAYTDVTSSSTGGYRLVLVPASRESSTTNIEIWYIRNANRIPLVTGGSQTVSDNTIIDIPEFYSFVKAHVKASIYAKDDPRFEDAVKMLAVEEKSMIDTLTNMVVDNDDEIEGDFSHYKEHS